MARYWYLIGNLCVMNVMLYKSDMTDSVSGNKDIPNTLVATDRQLYTNAIAKANN
ncbi:hypothetical protein Y699_04958 [Aspergillus fumigatus Z5]|nr:hypothetical protein Y699_04958 [Aspergillus fumigatus Z5]